MADAGEQTDLEQLISDFAKRRAEVDEELIAMSVRLDKLEDSNKILRSFAAFGAGFLAARIAISITRLAFGLDKKKAIKQLLLFSFDLARTTVNPPPCVFVRSYSHAVKILLAISTNLRQNRGSVDRLPHGWPLDRCLLRSHNRPFSLSRNKKINRKHPVEKAMELWCYRR